ncbi:glycosyltransferase family 4 protein [Leifsonia sp. F6_8S_P_1B]|uniref:Glycosyltransferase family 4 protein n=1 Tax=Leifsonia williamsii TaxID=3035919 RepID=A0ABT8KG70_9MICO|nr:glycosyltransferase family 4 protein [Leifsonia williamsii]MDN4616152.1 glycosyltransferase family 4 protein [Leifsonia williamsii]
MTPAGTPGKRPTIVLGVTVDLSLRLMAGFPAFLAKRGWDVHVVCSPGAALTALAGTPGVTVHPLPMRRDPSPVADLRSLFAWLRLLRRLRPDVVSAGTPKAGLLGTLAARLTRVKGRVYLLRGLRLETAQGLGRRLLTVLERLSVASAVTTVAVSRSLAARAVELRLGRPDRFVVLGDGSSNGVDVDAVERALPDAAGREALRSSLGLDPDLPVIGFVGRLTEDKGVAVLEAALRLLRSRGVEAQLLLVGSAENESGGTSLDVPGLPLTRTGFVTDPERYYALMDLLCLPTFREGFPNVVLEAAAASVPTVTTDATGAVDSVVDGETGLIVPVRDAPALADALVALIADPERRRRYGAAAHERARSTFDRPVVWAAQEEFYRRMLEREGPRA